MVGECECLWVYESDFVGVSVCCEHVWVLCVCGVCVAE